MTDQTPSPGIDPGLPKLTDIHLRALILSGLIDAMDNLVDLLGPRSHPVFSVLQVAVPLARDLHCDLEKVSDCEEEKR